MDVGRWSPGRLALITVLAALAVRAEVRLPDGQWFEQEEDLRVKVMGGYVAVSRTWLNNRWYFNPAWAPLRFSYDGLGQIATIERAGWVYQARGPGAWVFDNKNSIAAVAGAATAGRTEAGTAWITMQTVASWPIRIATRSR